MDLNKTGGPAYPTISGGPVDDKTFRWEGMTLFDWYVGQFAASGLAPEYCISYAIEILETRKKHLMETNDDQ
jgi:hypothetical protein